MFTADHGESFGERGRWFLHGKDVYDETMRVPLVIKPPAGTPIGRRGVPTPVSLVDVLPTVLDAIGLSVPGDLDGRSLLAAFDPRRSFPPRDVLLERHRDRDAWWGLVASGPDGGLRKTILRDRDGRAVAEAYDLGRDPLERRDLVAAGEAGGSPWRDDRARLERWIDEVAAHRLGFEPEESHLAPARRRAFLETRGGDPATVADLERLRRLGYVE